VKARLTGLPHEVKAAVDALYAAPGVFVVTLSPPLPCRGDSAEVRVYLELRVHETPSKPR
jgi:hypothetical protein